MIWIDIATPKCAMFFSKLIPEIKKYVSNNLIVTTRYSKGYTETKEILDNLGIQNYVIGGYGGQSKKGKFLARLKRSEEFIKLFDKIGYPKLFISWSVADSTQVAFGLGIKIINFNDNPSFDLDIKNKVSLLPVALLTIPFSDILFHPFIWPKKFFECAKQSMHYDFIDVCLYLKDIKKDKRKDFRYKFNIPTNRPTILIREEEYKAHYVKEKKNYIYELINRLKNDNFNLVIIPRYESDYLKKEFPFTYIIEEKLKPEEFYPFIDFFVGGGGTMTFESLYLGIPTLSMKSRIFLDDKYMIDHKLMKWTHDIDEAYDYIKENIGKRFNNKKYFCQGECKVDKIVAKIMEFYYE